MRGAIVVAGVLAACGRLGFDPEGARTFDGAPSGGDGPTAGGPDASTVCSGFICDDFESSTLDPRWDISTSMGSGGLDTTRAHSGTQSVHLVVNAITTSSNDVYALLHSEMGLPFTGTIYARAWVYVPSPWPTTPIDQIIDFSTLGGLGISTGTRDGLLVSNDYTSMQFGEGSDALPLDTWFCLQFEMPSGTTGTTDVALDGNSLADLTLTKTSTQPSPQQVYIGTEWAGTVTSAPKTEVWIDDVIVSTGPTTCAQE